MRKKIKISTGLYSLFSYMVALLLVFMFRNNESYFNINNYKMGLIVIICSGIFILLYTWVIKDYKLTISQILILFSWISLMISKYVLDKQAEPYYILFVSFLLLFLLCMSEMQFSQRNMKFLIDSYIVSAVIMSLLIIVQHRTPYAQYGIFRLALFFNSKEYYDVNFTSLYLLLPTLLAFYGAIKGKKKNKIWYMGATGINIIGILLLGSRLVFSIASAKKLMQYGWKILLADLSGTFFEQLRSLIIGKVYTTSDLAYYNRGKSFSSLVMDNISTAMMSVLFPDLANKSDDLEKVKLTLRKSLSVMLYIIFPLIGGLVVIAKPLVNVLLTEKWKQAIPFLQLLAVSSGIGLIGNISLQSIKAIGRSDIVLKLELIKKPIYLILLIIGIKISPIAIAVTMVLYSFYSSIANAMPLKKELNYTYKQQISDILPSLAATVIMCIAIAPFRAVIKSDVILLFIQVICGGFIYAMESIIFKISAFQYIKKIIIKGKSNE